MNNTSPRLRALGQVHPESYKWQLLGSHAHLSTLPLVFSDPSWSKGELVCGHWLSHSLVETLVNGHHHLAGCYWASDWKFGQRRLKWVERKKLDSTAVCLL